MLLLCASFLILNEASRFPGPDALLPAFATACTLVSGANDDWRGPALLLTAKPLQWLGTLSYSIYLWHWPIIVYAMIIEPSLLLGGRIACGLLTVACATASYRLLEQPIDEIIG